MDHFASVSCSGRSIRGRRKESDEARKDQQDAGDDGEAFDSKSGGDNDRNTYLSANPNRGRQSRGLQHRYIVTFCAGSKHNPIVARIGN